MRVTYRLGHGMSNKRVSIKSIDMISACALHQYLLTPNRSRSKSSVKYKASSSGAHLQHSRTGEDPRADNSTSDFTVKQAKGLGLTGYVQNARDGSVVGEAQGSEDDLNKLVSH